MGVGSALQALEMLYRRCRRAAGTSQAQFMNIPTRRSCFSRRHRKDSMIPRGLIARASDRHVALGVMLPREIVADVSLARVSLRNEQHKLPNPAWKS